jgi:hypothetical protein
MGRGAAVVLARSIFAMIFCGTTSATFRTVGLNGFGAFTGCVCSRFRCASVNGVVLMRGSPMSGGRSGNTNPSSRWANHSLNVVCIMRVCTAATFKNKKEHRVMVEQGRGAWDRFFTGFRSSSLDDNSATRGVAARWRAVKDTDLIRPLEGLPQPSHKVEQRDNKSTEAP